MKTFGLFMIMWIVSILATVNIWKGVSQDEMLKMLLATQLAYIMYRLIKEEIKDIWHN